MSVQQSRFPSLPSSICESVLNPCFAIKHLVTSLPKLFQDRFEFGANSDTIEWQIITLTPVEPESQSFLIGRLIDAFSFLHAEKVPNLPTCAHTYTYATSPFGIRRLQH